MVAVQIFLVTISVIGILGSINSLIQINQIIRTKMKESLKEERSEDHG